MKLIVGLGNPGEEYRLTRHNTGYQFIERYALDLGVKFKIDAAFRGSLATFNYEGEKIMLLKPITYMNLSGECVYLVSRYYKIDIDDLLVIYDDMDLLPGEIRFRPDGSSAGHKGIQNIIDYLETSKIKRLRIGIGHATEPVVDYVLEPYTKEERPLFEALFDNASSLIEDYLSLPFEQLMSKYNQKERHE